MKTITRFAPSPTGDLHVGGARTALYCYLWAKKNQGKFILRIEDTDRERSTQASVNVILEGMQWLGLNWDEGPYYQSQRTERYQQVIEQLLSNGNAYRCYCSKERLEQLRESQLQAKEKPRYDGHCRHQAKDASSRPYVIRFKTPSEGYITFTDLVKGEISIPNNELDDLILARSDGSPTYNFTVVVDDWDMGITEVLRGDDHINNTPRQIHLFKALGVQPPEYGHLPMLLGNDGKRLSKRHGALSVLEYEHLGILPQALLNYLIRLGWSHGDQEIFSIQEMIQFFDIHAIGHSPAAMNYEKLLWLNQHYLKTLSTDEIIPHLRKQFESLGIQVVNNLNLAGIILAQRDRCKTLKEMAQKSRFFVEEPVFAEPALLEKHFIPSTLEWLALLSAKLGQLEDWQTPYLHELLQDFLKEQNIKLGDIAPAVRLAITGGTVSPSLDITLSILGKAKSLSRLEIQLSKHRA